MGKGKRNKGTRARTDLRLLLTAGLRTSGGLRIRFAHEDEANAVESLVSETVDSQVGRHVDDHVPTACPSIVAGVQNGGVAFREALAHAMHAGGGSWSAFTLVAVSGQNEVVGAAVCSPPFAYLRDMISRQPHVGQRLLMQGVMGVSKVNSVAVLPGHRGQGVGKDLMTTAEGVLRRCGHMVMYGSCNTDVTTFYRRLGFNVADLDAPVSFVPALESKYVVSTPGMHIFMKNDLRRR